jgi:hypothetical protein
VALHYATASAAHPASLRNEAILDLSVVAHPAAEVKRIAAAGGLFLAGSAMSGIILCKSRGGCSGNQSDD